MAGTRAVGAPVRRALVLSILGLLGVLALAYFRVLFLGETFAVRDHLTWTLPSRAYLAEGLHQGRFPEWWDALRLGTGFASDPNNGVTYPLAWAVALVDPLLGADLLLLFHIFLAGMGGLLFARRLGASALGAFFGAAVLMTSGYVTSMIVNGTILLPIGWMPLVGWAALGVAQVEHRRDYFGRGLICAAVLAGSVASANPASMNNIVLAGAIVALTARRRASALLVLAAAGVLGVLMGAASVLVPLFTLPNSTRAGGLSLAESGAWSLHPLRLFDLIWPQFLGQGLRPERNLAELWAHGGGTLEANWAGSVYVGLPVLFCAGLAAARGGSLPRRLGLLSLFFLILALGTFTPVYAIYRAIFRFEHLLRYPEKHVASAVVLWSVLAAVGFDRLFDPAARRTGPLRISACLAILLAAGWCAATLARGTLAEMIVRASHARGRGIDARAALSAVLDGGLAATAVAALVPIALWLSGRPRFGRLARPCLVVVVVAQLIDHDGSAHVLIARNLVGNRPAILAALPTPPAGELPRVLRRAQDTTPIAVSGEERAWLLHQLAVQNDATRFGFGQLPGYLIAGTARFDALAKASGNANLERIMDLLDIRYLIIDVAEAVGMGMPSRSQAPFAGHVVLENEARRSRAFVAYRWRHGLSDEEILARLFVPNRSRVDFGAVRLTGPGANQIDAPEEARPCAMERPVPEHVILRCQAARAGYAVLLDEWTEGWTATLDNVPVVIERADVVFRAVALPAGSHVVEMRYRTPGLRSGALISCFGCLSFGILVLVWLVMRRRRRFSIDGPATAAVGPR